MTSNLNTSEYQTGIIKWFNRSKGYGFIEPDGSTQEVYVQRVWAEPVESCNLYAGAPVLYETVDLGKGPEARNVRRNRLTESSYDPIYSKR